MKKLTTKEFIDKANSIHNSMYDYSKVIYFGNNKKIIIGCFKHGDFTQTPRAHLSKQGCPKCCNTLKSNTEEFIIKSKLRHGDKYDYSKVQYEDNKKDVIIICRTHNIEFKQTPNSHLSDVGCPMCGGSQRLTTQEFIKKAKFVHKDKYDYSKVNYVNTKTPVIIICKMHNMEFLQKPSKHLIGQGCPHCSGGKGERIAREIIENIFKESFPTIRPSWLINPLTNYSMQLDGYCQNLNLAFEYQGDQHFKIIKKFKNTKDTLQKQRERDLIKANLCKKHNVKLIIINQFEQLSKKYILEEMKAALNGLVDNIIIENAIKDIV